jgi:hypothetical protein
MGHVATRQIVKQSTIANDDLNRWPGIPSKILRAFNPCREIFAQKAILLEFHYLAI